MLSLPLFSLQMMDDDQESDHDLWDAQWSWEMTRSSQQKYIQRMKGHTWVAEAGRISPLTSILTTLVVSTLGFFCDSPRGISANSGF